MTGLTFGNPDWLWGGIILLPLLALRAWSHWHAGRKLPGLVSPRLTGQLINGSSRPQRWVVFVLRTVAVMATLVALARPQYGFDEIETETQARNLIIAIDTSRSMLAVDLTPDRLSRAKLAAKDIVLALPEDRIGLLAFAGRPFLQAPLTVDHEAILESIDQLDTEIIPRGGTNLTAATELALDTFDEAELNQSALVIFSDGEALEGTEEIESIRSRAKKSGMSIIAVGVGTREGSIIPEFDQRGVPVPGVFIKDDEGQVVRSRLDPQALQNLASEGGVYVHLGGKSSLTRVVEQIQKGITTSREESESRLRPIERFMWPLSFALFCLALSHFIPLLWLKPRQSQSNWATTTASLAILMGFSGLLPSQSMGSDAVFIGHEAFLAEDYDTALRTYEGALAEKPTDRDRTRLQMGVGAASFRQGDYERATEAYGQALLNTTEQLREHAHYNLGNTLFRQGESSLTSMQQPANPDQLQNLSSPNDLIDTTIRQWESAIEHYESALALNQQNEQAGHNLDVVQKRLEELKNQQQEEQEEQEQQEEQNQEPQDGDQEESDQEQDPSDSEENEDEPSESEQDEQEDGENGEPSPDDSESEEGDEPEGEEESPESPQNEQGDQNQPQEQPDPNNEPEQPEAPEEGQLGTDPDQPQPQPPSQGKQVNPADLKQNPDTGYSPSEARNLLDALADETEVRPVLQPSGNESFKNW